MRRHRRIQPSSARRRAAHQTARTATPRSLPAGLSLEKRQEFRVRSSGTSHCGTGTGIGDNGDHRGRAPTTSTAPCWAYFRDDSLDARNHFDSLRARRQRHFAGPKFGAPARRQFGGSFGIDRQRSAPRSSSRRLKATGGSGQKHHRNDCQVLSAAELAVPRSATASRLPQARHAIIIPGADRAVGLYDINTDYRDETARCAGNSLAAESASARSLNWSSCVRLFHDRGKNDWRPSGRDRPPPERWPAQPRPAPFSTSEGIPAGVNDQRVQVRL